MNMIQVLERPKSYDLPPVDRYWNPGEETGRDKLKLQLLHRAAEAGGVMRHVFGRLAKKSIGILTYHRIASECLGVPFPTINVTPETFRRQLMGLKKAGFRFRSLNSVLDACQTLETANRLPERTVVVTFDDIYDNVFRNAWPVLCELEIPATFFVSTAFIDSTVPFQFDDWAMKYAQQVPEEAWLPITDRHLNAMTKTGHAELGAHTHTHQDFRDRPNEFSADVKAGLNALQERCDINRLPFAFPYGSPRLGFCSSPLMDVVMDSGLSCGLTTASQTNKIDTSPFGWGRFHVFEHDTPSSLAARLDGWYEWLPKTKDFLTGVVK